MLKDCERMMVKRGRERFRKMLVKRGGRREG